jgi:hypothetical protein
MSLKRKRFEKVAIYRVENILKTLDLLANCSNSYNYEYEKDDIDKIFKAINYRVKITHLAFKKEVKETKFEL